MTRLAPRPSRQALLAALLLLGAAAGVGRAADTPAVAAARAPSGPWLEYANPEEAGFSAAKLEEARGFADSIRSGAVMAIYGGRVVAAWGDVSRNFMAHSVRKSLVGALYGIAVDRRQVDLDATLAALGIDDQPPLLPVEKGARVRDLLAARSGVYHPAAYAGADQDDRPARGSHPPGTFWFYNNWDFNTLETIYERATGKDVFSGFAAALAQPLAMEDYDPANGLVVLEPSQSRMPAHAFRISTRDLARFGLLYLDGGKWSAKQGGEKQGETQVVPSAWIRESLTAHSDAGRGAAYGYLWWIYAAASLGQRYPQLDRGPVYLARGTGGQAVFVIPHADMVVVHRGDTDNDRPVGGGQIWELVERLVAARTGSALPAPIVRPMTPLPLASQAPPPPPSVFLTLEPAALAALAGDYALSGGGVVRVFLHDGRLFVNVPGQGEAELFAVTAEEFILRVEAGVRVVFERDAGGRGLALRATVGPQRLEARRTPAQ